MLEEAAAALPDVEDRALLIACLKQVTAAARPD
jgi:hypothetical protein